MLSLWLPCFGKEAPFEWSLNDNGVTLKVAPGCYVYSQDLEVDAYSGMVPVKLIAPAPESHQDTLSGDVTAYLSGIHQWKSPDNRPISGAKISYQGCLAPSADTPGICYLPKTIELGTMATVADNAKPVSQNVESLLSQLDSFKVGGMHEGTMEKADFIRFLKSDGAQITGVENIFANHALWVITLLVMLGGLALNFTPCVLPMIPINLAIIGADGTNSGKTGLYRGMIYGLGMALTYGILGLMVVLGGAKFGSLNSSSIFNFVVAAVFFILALAMLEVFNLDFSGLQNRINPNKMQLGKLLAAFVLGATSALLAGACVAPVIIGMMIFSAQLYSQGNYYGLFLPFLFGVGMALPWPLAGAGLGVLPKPGRWMVRIKQAFAFVIIVAGVYYAYLGYTLLPGDFSAKAELENLQLGMQESRDTGKPLLIDFWASWCKNCHHMDHTVMNQPEVKELLAKDFVTVKFQAENLSDPSIQELLDHYQVRGLPTFIILLPEK